MLWNNGAPAVRPTGVTRRTQPTAWSVLPVLLPILGIFMLVLIIAALSGSGPRRRVGSPPVPPSPLPSVAASGVAYPFVLEVRCGVGYADFSGRWWRADSPEATPTSPDGYAYEGGTMTLISAVRAEFRRNDGSTMDFLPYPGSPPPCG